MGRNIDPKPDYVELPEDKDWYEMTPQQRYYYKTEHHPEPNNKTKLIRRTKNEAECSECGEDRDVCLDFHHPEDVEKNFSIGGYGYSDVSYQALKEEIEKCVILCSNCHRVHHSN